MNFTGLFGEEGEPEAVIEATGRWWYHMNIRHGLTELNEGWFVFGRRRAEKVARRKLRWYRRKLACEADRWTIS